ncbi:hypothetical protein CTI14_72500, partial [Methylobacterium radiotolerans]
FEGGKSALRASVMRIVTDSREPGEPKDAEILPPLFEGGKSALRASVMRIVTDSREPGEPKDAEILPP